MQRHQSRQFRVGLPLGAGDIMGSRARGAGGAECLAGVVGDRDPRPAVGAHNKRHGRRCYGRLGVPGVGLVECDNETAYAIGAGPRAPALLMTSPTKSQVWS